MGAWGFGPFDSDQGCDWVDGITRAITGELEMKKVNLADIDQANVRFVMEQAFAGELDDDPHVRYAAVGLVAIGLQDGPAQPPLSSYSSVNPPLLSEETAAALAPNARETLHALRTKKDWIDLWHEPESLYEAMDAVDRILSGDNNAPKEIS
jgi:hypothetical protein